MNSYFSVGRREQFLRTCEMLTSSHSTRRNETAVTVKTIVASPCWALWGKSSPVWCWTDSKCWLNGSIQRCSVASDLRDQRSTWSSHWESCRRSAGSRDSHSTSPSSTRPRPSTWSAGKASSPYCTGSDVPPSFWRWSHPTMMKWKVPSSTMAHIQKLSWSEAAWSKAVFSPRHSSATFFPCCCATPSVSQKMVSSFALGATATFSTLQVCAQRPRSAGSWLGRCCFLMTPS